MNQITGQVQSHDLRRDMHVLRHYASTGILLNVGPGDGHDEYVRRCQAAQLPDGGRILLEQVMCSHTGYDRSDPTDTLGRQLKL